MPSSPIRRLARISRRRFRLKCSLYRMPGLALRSSLAKRGLTLTQRQSAGVGSVDRQQIERVGVGAGVIDASLQPVEIGNAVLAVAAAFRVDDRMVDFEPGARPGRSTDSGRSNRRRSWCRGGRGLSATWICSRNPSCLISWTQPSAVGALSTRVGRQATLTVVKSRQRAKLGTAYLPRLKGTQCPECGPELSPAARRPHAGNQIQLTRPACHVARSLPLSRPAQRVVF